jgi:hypothetical protein
MAIKPVTIEDIERMARGLGKDPDTLKSLERQFREIMGSQGTDSRNKDELDQLYEKIKEKFEHGFPLDIDIGEENE